MRAYLGSETAAEAVVELSNTSAFVLLYGTHASAVGIGFFVGRNYASFASLHWLVLATPGLLVGAILTLAVVLGGYDGMLQTVLGFVYLHFLPALVSLPLLVFSGLWIGGLSASRR